MPRQSPLLWVCLAACATPGADSPSRTATGAASTVTATSFAQSGAPAALVSATSGAALIADDGPPISLTASDGTGLVLTKLEAKAVVEGPFALTELHLRFQNPQDRVLEGRFAITLPDGAALSRFAMHQDKGWMEAEVVERMAARRAYEDFLHRRQDPALLENEAGNEFSARVFPIPAKGTKDLIVTFSHEVTGTYTLPLRGLPQIGEVAASVKVARPDRAAPAYDETTLAQRAWQPDRDFTVSVGAAPTSVRAGEFVAAVVDPLADAAPAAMPGVMILFDTSASRAPGFAGQVENLVAMVGELGRAHGASLPVTIAAFDQSVEEVYRGPASGVAAAKDALMARRALGASDTAGALAWAAAHAPAKRVVLIGDGVSTVGEDAAVGEALGALKGAIDRLDVVLVGGIRDRDAAARLARGNFKQDGAILDGARGPAEVARRLGLATRSGLKVEIAGARWVWPKTLDGVQPGDTQVVVAALGSAAVRSAPRITVKAGDATTTFAPATVPLPLLARAAAGAEIARLESDRAVATDAKQKDALAKRIISLSTRNRVLSDLTALLVLETEEDYQRFEIPRTALVDIMVVGAGGIELQHRKDIVMIATPEPDKTGVDEGGKGKDDKKTGEKQKVKVYDFSDDVVEGDLVRPDGMTVDARGFSDSERVVATAQINQLELLSAEEREEERPSPSSPPAEAPRTMRPPPAPSPPPGRRPAAGSGSSGGDGDDGRAAGVVGNIADPTPEPPADEEPKQPETPALEGELATVMALIKAGKADDALAHALAWRDKDAGDVLALVALGEALEAKKMPALAARAYGSIIDLFPSRADLRRFAGERLERIGEPAHALAIDTYRQAVESRPDHLTGHRLLAMALVRAGDLPGAFAALETGLTQSYPGDRFRGGTRILAEDLGMVAAAWISKAPREKAAIEARLAKLDVKVAREASLRFVLYWETDANDVDFHIRDAKGGHAYYKAKSLRSGGELYEDVTTGYGPENFTIPGGGRAAPYDLQIHYYSRGPMGYGMGMLEILRYDGKGGLAFEHRPYIVMVDGAFVDLGRVDSKVATAAIAK